MKNIFDELKELNNKNFAENNFHQNQELYDKLKNYKNSLRNYINDHDIKGIKIHRLFSNIDILNDRLRTLSKEEQNKELNCEIKDPELIKNYRNKLIDSYKYKLLHPEYSLKYKFNFHKDEGAYFGSSNNTFPQISVKPHYFTIQHMPCYKQASKYKMEDDSFKASPKVLIFDLDALSMGDISFSKVHDWSSYWDDILK